MRSLDLAFTEHDTPEVRARIESDLRAIVATVREHDPALVGLILTGGFSRGEGTTRGGRPVNDYDLVAVRSRPGGRGRYAAIGSSLTKRLGIEVDLLPVWRARLPHVRAKLFWLDLRAGGRTLEGPEGLEREVGPLAAWDLPRRETARLLANRAAGLLLALPGPQRPPDLALADLQATKAVLAAMDASLLARGRYAPRLRERLEAARGHEDHALFARAVEWKLAPDAPILGAPWWEQAAGALLRAVERTGARDVRDGLEEACYHALAAKRLALQPSRRVRMQAWRLLSSSRFPDGTGADWALVKERFFAARARTLQ